MASKLSSARRISRGASLAMLGNIINQVCFLFASIAIARYFGKEAFGVYSFAMSLSFVFAVLSIGGLQIILIREVARGQQGAGVYLGNALLIILALTALALMLLSCVVGLMDLSPFEVKAVYIAAVANLMHMYGRVAIAVCRAFERMAYEGVLLTLQGLVFLLLVWTAVYIEANLLSVIAALLVSYVLMAWLAYFLVSKYLTRPDFRLDLSLCKFLVREAAPVGVSYFLAILHDRIGAIVLQMFRGSAEVGLFGTAFSLTRNFSFIPLVVTGAILPTFSRLAVSSRENLSVAYAKAFKFLFVLGLSLALGTTIWARPIILLIFGAEFTEASVALQVVAWSLLFLFLNFVAKTTLEAINRQVLWTCTLAIGAVTNLILNVALIPQMGILGASLALVLADMMVFGIAFYFIYRELSLPVATIAMGILKCLASGALMGVAVRHFRNQSFFILVCLGAFVYSLSLLLLRVFDHEELALMKEVVCMDDRIRWLARFKSEKSSTKESI